jgi:hypothetical protein
MTIDNLSGLLTYSCAGHPPPIIVRTDNHIEILDKHGPVIGAEKNRITGRSKNNSMQEIKLFFTPTAFWNCATRMANFSGKNDSGKYWKNMGEKHRNNLWKPFIPKQKPTATARKSMTTSRFWWWSIMVEHNFEVLYDFLKTISVQSGLFTHHCN